MSTTIILGTFMAVLAGFIMGVCPWPMKILRRYQFEHWLFVSVLFSAVLLPWAVTIIFCPNAISAIGSVGIATLAKISLFSLAWGTANVLVTFCFTRIGVSLATALLAGVGGLIGALTPLIVKGSGQFSHAPGVASTSGRVVIMGMLVMVIGITLVALAGFGRDRVLKTQEKKLGGFATGLIASVTAGFLCAAPGLSFVYYREPVQNALQAQGANPTISNIGMWAVVFFAGALVNFGYAFILMSKNKSWKVLTSSWREFTLSAIIGVHFFVAIILTGESMLALGALGGSVGWGVYQAMQMMGSQGLGFVSGEWKGVKGRPLTQMGFAIAALTAASVIMAYGSSMAGK